MNIIKMNNSHIESLAQIEKMCFHTPWTELQLADELDNENCLFLVAEQDGKIAGYVGCQTTIDGGYITNVAVHTDYRRQGVASMLINELNRQCEAKQLEFVTLEVRLSNNAAKALYEKMGYKPVGIRKNFYRKPSEDALLMTYEIYKNEEE